MKRKIRTVVFVLVIGLLLSACGKNEYVSRVEDLISSIGRVTIDSLDEIEAAERAYDALSEKDKKQVENYQELVIARGIIDALMNTGGDANNTYSVKNEEEAENDDNIIVLDPAYVAIDDENIKIEITSVSQEVYNDAVSYYINYTVTNKNTEYDVNVSVATGDCSIGGYTVQFANMNNDTRAGKINDTACFTCRKGSLGSEGSEHIEALEDLLQFEAQVGVYFYKDTGSSRNIQLRYNFQISLNK